MASPDPILLLSPVQRALSILAAIEDPAVISKILTHLGLPSRAPPRAPARLDDLLQIA